MKFRNKFIAKRIGTKTLASLLAFGMALGSPMAAFADDGETAVVAENTVQAKKTLNYHIPVPHSFPDNICRNDGNLRKMCF